MRGMAEQIWTIAGTVQPDEAGGGAGKGERGHAIVIKNCLRERPFCITSAFDRAYRDFCKSGNKPPEKRSRQGLKNV